MTAEVPSAGEPKSKQEELESSLKRRRLLNKDQPKGMISKPPLEDDQTEEPPEYEDYFDSLHSRHPTNRPEWRMMRTTHRATPKSPTSRGENPRSRTTETWPRTKAHPSCLQKTRRIPNSIKNGTGK
ncbi:hypothetical protein CEXT_638631 [Caerostris extrusa]|uniref:Uncharacterized protein n=1 Tax=Caerostris extrusa TaxID=172846 RepID=A0AAV4PSM9_CAEEX|nr:hypothetical protein CEXT_638631 [Caerostris extrusa]